MITVPIPTQPFNNVQWARLNHWLPYNPRGVLTDIPGAGVLPSRRIPRWPQLASQATFVPYWPGQPSSPLGDIFDTAGAIVEREVSQSAAREVQKAAMTYILPPVLGAVALSVIAIWVAVSAQNDVKRLRKANCGRRRNGGGAGEYEVGIASEFRYRATASERRLWGGSTVTQFIIEDPNYEGAARYHRVMGYGPTPGERRTDALRRYGRKIGRSVVGKLRPRPFQGSLA